MTPMLRLCLFTIFALNLLSDLQASHEQEAVKQIKRAFSTARSALLGRAMCLEFASALQPLTVVASADPHKPQDVEDFNKVLIDLYGRPMDTETSKAARTLARDMRQSVDMLESFCEDALDCLALPPEESVTRSVKQFAHLWCLLSLEHCLYYERTTTGTRYVPSADSSLRRLQDIMNPVGFSDELVRRQTFVDVITTLIRVFARIVPADSWDKTPRELLEGDSIEAAPPEESVVKTLFENSLRVRFRETREADEDLDAFLAGTTQFPPEVNRFVILGRSEDGRQTPKVQCLPEFSAYKLFRWGAKALETRHKIPKEGMMDGSALRSHPHLLAWRSLMSHWFETHGNVRKLKDHPLAASLRKERRMTPMDYISEYAVKGSRRRADDRITEVRWEDAEAFLRGDIPTLFPKEKMAADAKDDAKIKKKAKPSDRRVLDAHSSRDEAATGGGAPSAEDTASTREAAAAMLKAAREDEERRLTEVRARQEHIEAQRLKILEDIRSENERHAEERRRRRMELSSTHASPSGTESFLSADTDVTLAGCVKPLARLSEMPHAVLSFVSKIQNRGMVHERDILGLFEGLQNFFNTEERGFFRMSLSREGSRVNVTHPNFGSMTLHLPHNGSVSMDAGSTRSPYMEILRALLEDFEIRSSRP